MTAAVRVSLPQRPICQRARAAAVKTEAGLVAWWREPSASKDLPGARWATLTHPRCTPAIEHHVLGPVHRVQ